MQLATSSKTTGPPNKGAEPNTYDLIFYDFNYLWLPVGRSTIELHLTFGILSHFLRTSVVISTAQEWMQSLLLNNFCRLIHHG